MALPLVRIGKSDKHGYGLFATADIPAGTRLLAEAPLLVIPRGDYIAEEIERELAKLPQDKRDLFMSLSSAHNQPLSNWPSRGIHPSVTDARERQRITEQHATRTGKAKTPLSVFMTNAIAWGESGAAVFATASRFNHSCVPSAHYSWNEGLGVETVHAVRDIKEGEEVTVTYCDPFSDLAMRTWQCKHYGFSCACQACVDVGFGHPAELSDAQRWAMDSRDRRCRIRDLCEFLGERGSDGLGNYGVVEKGTRDEMKYLLEAVGLAKQEGLVKPELGHWFLAIADNAWANGDLRLARRATEQGYKTLVICLGEDATASIKAREVMQIRRSTPGGK